MKRILFFLLSLVMITNVVSAQNWTIAVCSGGPPASTTSTAYGPMYTTSTAGATSRYAYIYPAAQLTDLIGKSLNKVYFHKGTTTTAGILGTSNFKVYVKETTATDWGGTALDWATAITGATLVYDGDPATTVGTDMGWKGFAFSSNITYTGQNLAVFTEYSNATASTSIPWSYEYTSTCVNTSNSNTTKYITNTTGTLGTSLSSTNYRRPYIGFDYPGGCSAPAGLTSSSVTTNGATISWSPSMPVSASGYQYYVSTTNTAPTALTTPTGSTAAGVTTASLTGLASATTYYFWVRGNCGATQSVWSSSGTFTTLCTSFTPTYTQDFATFTPNCWSLASGGTPATAPTGTTAYWVADGFLNVGSTGAARINLYSSGRAGWLISPTINLTGGGFRVSFDYGLTAYAATGTSAMGSDDVIQFAVSNDNGATWTVLQTWNAANAPNNLLNTYTYILSTYNSATTKFAFFGNDGAVDDTQDYDFFVDNFVVEPVPTCASPTAVTANASGATAGTISWTAASPAPASGYQYYVSTTNTAPTAASTPSGSVAAGVTTANLTGLSANTTYYVWVRSNCGTSQSSWAVGATFFTGYCQPSSTSTATYINSVTTTGGTSNISNLNTGYSTGGYANYSATQSVTVPASLQFTLTTAMVGGTSGLSVYIDWNNNLSFEASELAYTSGTYLSDGNNSTSPIVVPVTTTPGTYRMRVIIDYWAGTPDACGFSATGPRGEAEDYSLVVTAAPSCLPPSGLISSAVTTTGATISWTAASPVPASGYQYYVSTSSTAPTAATTPTGSTAAGIVTATLTGLSSATTYYVWVRSNCAAADQSVWTSSISFMTFCAPFTLPWTENFDALTTLGASSFPNCWTKENGDWATANAGYTSYNDPASAPNYLTNAWSATNEYIWTPGFQLTAGTSYDFKFDWVGDGLTGWDGDVWVNTAAASTSGTPVQLGTPFVAAATAPPATYSTLLRSFTPTTSGVYYFAIRINATFNPYYLGFDNFALNVTPTCAGPTNVTASNVSANAATISWTAPATAPANGYQYYVSTSSTAPTAATTPTGTTAAGVTTATITLSGTNTYYVWVRSVCSGTLSSSWTGPISVYNGYCTPSSTSTVTHINNFSTSGGTTNISNLATGYTTGGYADYYPTHSASVPASLPVTVNFTLAGSGGGEAGVAIWVDWNNNLIFEANERVYNAGTYLSIGNYSVNFTVPAAQPLGSYRMRIVCDYWATSPDPCTISATGPRGEAEDYKITVLAAPTCRAPLTLTVGTVTSSSAVISWTASTTPPANGYQYYVSTTNTAPTAATIPTGSVAAGVTTATLTGLNPITTYYVWVRSNCTTTDQSIWGASGTFLTMCVPQTLPWTENFDALTTLGATSFPPCWKKENGDWATANAGYTTYNDPRSLPNYLVNAWSATNEFIWTPGFQLTAGQSYDFGFAFVGDGYATWQGDVFYNVTQSSVGATQLGGPFVTPDTVTRQVYKQVWRQFVPTTSGVYYFAIRSNCGGAPWYMGFDDFQMLPTPTCPNPATVVTYPNGGGCNNTTSLTPIITGTTGGTFSSTAGLTINATTGVINPSTSTLGTYTVTYTVVGLGSCGTMVKTTQVMITEPKSATFSYPVSTACGNAAPIAPTFTGWVGGVFTSATGLAINPANGVVTPTTSTGGTYTITYTIPAYGGCPAFTTTSPLTINAVSVAPTSITASDTVVCSTNSSVTLSVVGGSLGTGASWKWYTGSCGGTLVGTGATLTTSITANTTFYVRAEGTCNNTNCASITVRYESKPDVTIAATPAPIVTPSYNVTLTATVTPTGSWNYWWYRDNILVAGQTGNSIEVTNTEFGNYYVIVRGERCADTSNTVQIVQAQTNHLFVMPSPGNGVFNVAYYSSIPSTTPPTRTVMVYDSKGALVFNKTYTTYANMPVNITQAAAGIYRVLLVDAKGKRIATGAYRKQ